MQPLGPQNGIGCHPSGDTERLAAAAFGIAKEELHQARLLCRGRHASHNG